MTAAYVDPRQGVGYGKLGIAVVFPARPRRAGRAGCRVCRAAGRTGAAWKQAPIPPHKLRECERLQQEHMSLFFLSDFRRLNGSHQKESGREGGTQRLGMKWNEKKSRCSIHPPERTMACAFPRSAATDAPPGREATIHTEQPTALHVAVHRTQACSLSSNPPVRLYQQIWGSGRHSSLPGKTVREQTGRRGSALPVLPCLLLFPPASAGRMLRRLVLLVAVPCSISPAHRVSRDDESRWTRKTTGRKYVPCKWLLARGLEFQAEHRPLLGRRRTRGLLWPEVLQLLVKFTQLTLRTFQ